MNRLWIAFFWIVLVAVVLVRYAEPVGDGDLFWQMAYGKQLLERGTLIPDHTIYSWTDASHNTIYCSWVAEILFYKGYQLGEALGIGGLTPLFAFRYLVILGCLALGWIYSYAVGAHKRLETYLLLLVLALSSYVGTILKPELFSLLFLNATAFCLFTFKLRARQGKSYGLYLWAIPVMMLVWVNTHGVFLFGGVAIFLFVVGEVLNKLLSPRIALDAPALKKLVICLFVSGAATLVTPYFWRYDWQLIEEWLGMVLGWQSAGDAAAYKSLAAHMTIFQVQAFHFIDYMEFMGFAALITLVSLFIVSESRNPDDPALQNRIDFTMVILNLLFAFLYTWYLRTTFYWPPLFFYSIAYGYWLCNQYRPQPAEMPPLSSSLGWALLICGATFVVSWDPGDANHWWFVPALAALVIDWLVSLGQPGPPDQNPLRPRMIATAVTLALIGFFSIRAVYESVYLPYSSSWCGFGITYWNPVVESEWLEKFHPTDKIFNDYDSGGWLIWKFHPKMKVMIDPRSFPYRKWYKDYIEYENGQHFKETQERFKENGLPEVAICSLKNQHLWRSFMNSGEWVPAWIGPSSVIFCKRGKTYPPEASQFAPDRFRQVKNSGKLLQIFQFACEIQLFEVGWQALDALSENFNTTPEDKKLIKTLTDYKECILALQKNDLKTAIARQEACRRDGMFYSAQILYNLYDARIKQIMAETKGPPALGSPESAEIGNLTLKMQRVQQGLMP